MCSLLYFSAAQAYGGFTKLVPSPLHYQPPHCLALTAFDMCIVASLKLCCSFLCCSNSYGQIVVQFAWVERHFHIASGSLSFCRWDFAA